MTVTQNMYKELNLKEGASLSEIKAAWRVLAKAYHPDSAQARGGADPGKFQKACEAYRSLLRDALNGKAPEPEKAEAFCTPCAITFTRHKGLDIVSGLRLEKPIPLRDVNVFVPVVRREACPRCLGQGVTLVRKGSGSVYKTAGCGLCGGKGHSERETVVELTLTVEMLQSKKVRVRGMGLYVPKEGKRGDLVLNLDFNEALPRHN
jgi:DnaJ-class molecular chaperone